LNEIQAKVKFVLLVALCLVGHHLVPVLATNYKQHILSPAKTRSFGAATHCLIKMKWSCHRSSISFCIIMPTKAIIALLAPYSFIRPIFHTTSLPAL
jgi:hypothetical protein